MADIKTLKNKIKFKQSPAKVKLAVGRRSMSVPAEASAIVGTKYIYVSIPAMNGFFEMGKGKLAPVTEATDAMEQDILAAANPPRKRGRRARKVSAALPEDVMKMLMKSIPDGHKLAWKDGKPVIVKSRVRRKG